MSHGHFILGLWTAAALVACDGEPAVELDAAGHDAEVHDTGAHEITPDEGNQLRNGVTARVEHIVDGDTFDLVVGDAEPRTYTIRMRGLSAPECLKDAIETAWGWRYACDADDELYGLASYQALYGMLHGQTVVVTCDAEPGAWCPTDFYDRYLAYVAVDGVDIATEMARAGAAFSYTDYPASRRGDICAAEYEARAAERGIWALGSLDTIMAGMHQSTQEWYLSAHDARCDAAIAARAR